MIYFLIILLTLTYLVYKWLNIKYGYWERKKIKYVKPLPFVGNYKRFLFHQERVDQLLKQAYEYHKDEQVVGYYEGLKPCLLVRDPELLRYVFIKDFPNFATRDKIIRHSFLDDHLFAIEAERWKILRQKLTPIFTSGKLKGMVPLIEKSIKKFIGYVDKRTSEDNHELRSLIAKYTLESVGSCVFGVEIDALNDNAEAFERIGALIFRPPLSVKTWVNIRLVFPQLTHFLSLFNYRPFIDPTVENFFQDLTGKLLQEREGKPKVRHDFMDLMIELKEQGKIGVRDSEKENDLEMDKDLIAAQAFVFYAAGFETSSSTMSFLLYELALNKTIQDRAYEEIRKVSEKYNGKLVYDSIAELQYLSMCFDETLRKYPIVPNLERTAANTYTFPGTNITVDKGTKIGISTSGLHHDPQYYPNPEVYDPDRFSPENKHKIPACAYLPFGEGPRNCIGLRFSKVSSMLLLSNFLMNFEVKPLAETKEIVFSTRHLTLAPENGLNVRIFKR